MHECPAKGCTDQVPDRMLMCRPHWYMVPPDLRAAVWAAYRGGAGVGSDELLTAHADAIEAVNRVIDGRRP